MSTRYGHYYLSTAPVAPASQSLNVTLTTSPSISRIRALLRTVTPSVTATPQISATRRLLRTITSSLSLVATKIANIEQTLIAAMSATAIVSTLAGRIRALTASATTTASLSTLRALLRTVTATVSLIASLSYESVLARILTASVNTSASFHRSFTKILKVAQARLNFPVYNTLYATTAPAWGSNATSSDVAAGDVTIYSEMSADTYSVFGLITAGVEHTSWTGIDYGLYAQGTTLTVYESGTTKGTFTVANGDTLSITRTFATGTIEYFKNGSLIYTSLVTDTDSLEVAGSLYRDTTPNVIKKARVEIGDAYPVPVTWSYFDQAAQVAESDTSVTGPSIATVRSLLRTLTFALGLDGVLTRVQGRLMSASVSVSASLATIRTTIAQLITAGLSVTASLGKDVFKTLTPSLTVAASFVRSLTHGMTALLTIPAVLMIKRTIISMVAEATVSATLSTIRALKRTITVTASLVPTLGTIKALLRTLTASVTTAVSIARDRIAVYEKALVAGLSAVPSMQVIRFLQRDLSASATASASLARGQFLALATTVSMSASLLKDTAKNLAASISVLPSIESLRALSRAITTSVSTAATIAKDFGLLLVAPVTLTATRKRFISLARTVGISLTPSNLVEKLTNFLTLTTGITLNATIPSRLKGLGQSMIAGVSASTSFIRHITINRTAQLDLSASFLRLIAVPIMAALTVTGSVLKAITHSMSTALALTATMLAARRIKLALTAALALTASLLAEAKGSIFKGMLAARVSIGGALIESVNTIEQGTVIAVLSVKDSVATASVATKRALIRATKKVFGQ